MSIHKDCCSPDDQFEKFLNSLELFLAQNLGVAWDYQFEVEAGIPSRVVNLDITITHPDDLDKPLRLIDIYG